MQNLKIYKINNYDISKGSYKRICYILQSTHQEKHYYLNKNINKLKDIYKILSCENSILKKYINDSINIFKIYKKIISYKEIINQYIETQNTEKLKIYFNYFLTSFKNFKDINNLYLNRKISKKYLKIIINKEMNNFIKNTFHSFFSLSYNNTKNILYFDEHLKNIFHTYIISDQIVCEDYCKFLFHKIIYYISEKKKNLFVNSCYNLFFIFARIKLFDKTINETFFINCKENYIFFSYINEFLFPVFLSLHSSINDEIFECRNEIKDEAIESHSNKNFFNLEHFIFVYEKSLEFENYFIEKYSPRFNFEGIISKVFLNNLLIDFVKYTEEEILNIFINRYQNFDNENKFKENLIDNTILDSCIDVKYLLEKIFVNFVKLNSLKENYKNIIEKKILMYYFMLYLKYNEKENYKNNNIVLNSFNFLIEIYKKLMKTENLIPSKKFINFFNEIILEKLH